MSIKSNFKCFNDKNGNPEKIKLYQSFSEIKNFAKANKGEISGVAVPYGQQTQDWRKLSFAMGAFKILKKTALFVNHDSWDVKAMVGATEYSDNPLGVLFKAKLNLKDKDVTEKIIPLIEMGALEGVSIGANILRKEDVYDDTGERIGTIVTEAEIVELSIVTFQAFENAVITESLAQEKNMTNKPNKKNNEIVVLAETQDVETPVEPVVVPAEEVPVEEVPAEEVPVEEVPAAPVVEEEDSDDDYEEPTTVAPVVEENSSATTPEVFQMTFEDFKKQIAEKDAEILKLKKEANEKAKNDCIDNLIASGIIHTAQKERIFKSFDSALSITEFYKDVPASYSVKPKGQGPVDLTEESILEETYQELSKQTSLSAEDYKKYNNKK
jgi:HK97 family phage prohead protease